MVTEGRVVVVTRTVVVTAGIVVVTGTVVVVGGKDVGVTTTSPDIAKVENPGLSASYII